MGITLKEKDKRDLELLLYKLIGHIVEYGGSIITEPRGMKDSEVGFSLKILNCMKTVSVELVITYGRNGSSFFRRDAHFDKSGLGSVVSREIEEFLDFSTEEEGMAIEEVALTYENEVNAEKLLILDTLGEIVEESKKVQKGQVFKITDLFSKYRWDNLKDSQRTTVSLTFLEMVKNKQLEVEQYNNDKYTRAELRRYKRI